MSPAQTVIPAAVTFLLGYQGALTRTSRLRKSIRADLDMLDALPDDHPSREALTRHSGSRSTRSSAGRRGSSAHAGPLGAGFGIAATIAVFLLLTATWGAATRPGSTSPSRHPRGRTGQRSPGARASRSSAPASRSGRGGAGVQPEQASGYSPASLGVTRTEAGSK